jgi:hypothetical protein
MPHQALDEYSFVTRWVRFAHSPGGFADSVVGLTTIGILAQHKATAAAANPSARQFVDHSKGCRSMFRRWSSTGKCSSIAMSASAGTIDQRFRAAQRPPLLLGGMAQPRRCSGCCLSTP